MPVTAISRRLQRCDVCGGSHLETEPFLRPLRYCGEEIEYQHVLEVCRGCLAAFGWPVQVIRLRGGAELCTFKRVPRLVILAGSREEAA